MSKAEQLLADALGAAASAVREETLRPLTVARAPGRLRQAAWSARRAVTLAPLRPTTAARRSARLRRWGAPVSAAVTIALVAGAVAVLPQLLGRGARSQSGPAAATVQVGGFPTGIAFDAAQGTVYVSAGRSNTLTMIDVTRCRPAARCSAAGRVSTHGRDPIGVAVDDRTQTVYAVNGGSDTLAVINAATCNAHENRGCAATPALVHVGSGAEFLAVDPLTDTIYVANTNAGTVSVIDGRTCNASDTSGCGRPPATVRVGSGAFPIAVDPLTDTVYVGIHTGIAVVDGRTCNASDTSGCGHSPAMIDLRGYPAGIAVDESGHTVYVSNESGYVAVIDSNTCDATDTAGCASHHASVLVGSDARGDVFAAADSTVYVANAASDTISMINTRTCGAVRTVSCGRAQPAFPVGASPRRLAIDPATRTLYVVNVIASTVSVVGTRSCNAARTDGCPKSSPPGTNPGGVRHANSATGMQSDCGPAVDAAASGQPAANFTSASTELASGSVAGQAWSVWAKKGESEPNALEDGGLVLDGRWYGLCAGFPNIAELELIDASGDGIAYGFVALPGTVRVRLTSGQVLPSPQVVKLAHASFFIGALPASACSYRSMVLNALSGAGSSMHYLGFGSCAVSRVVAINESYGAWGTGSSEWSDPGQGAGRGSPASGHAGSGNLPNMQDQCIAGPTNSGSGLPAAPATVMMRSSVRVAAGTTGGLPWTLWSSRRSAGVTGIEQGSLVVNGRWYGLCPGPPNPAEFELIDTGGPGLIYGYVANPGSYTIRLSGSIPPPRLYRVQGGTFFIGTMPRSACDYKAVTLDALNGSADDMHELDFGGRCQAGRLVTIVGGHGAW